MQIWPAGPLLGGTAQGSRHLIELFAAFGLTTLIGLERTIQGKVAGLRTQTIVGTSAALIELDSDPHDYERDQVGVTMTLTGSRSSTRHRCSLASTACPRWFRPRKSRTDGCVADCGSGLSPGGAVGGHHAHRAQRREQREQPTGGHGRTALDAVDHDAGQSSAERSGD